MNFEGSADVIGAVFAAQLQGFFRHGRRCYIIDFQAPDHQVADGNIIAAEMREGYLTLLHKRPPFGNG
ncbi:hypothetical protein SDC9_186461 [bioreactor metagenome]|uniref:Uncharacterized protein n=1 Tax=bioreactor metagenome TaxID=1076179 RepID=A0A645HK08_9ZZZZ